MMNTFSHLHMPPRLAFEFLAVFSRMEYALKSTGYAIGNDSKVEPAWDRFANEIHDEFSAISSDDLLEARRYILDKPPRKQVLIDNKVEFQDQALDPKQRETQQVIRFIRTVRNNLFHGGKYLPGGEVESGRNKALVESSLTLLLACLELNPAVRESYEF